MWKLLSALVIVNALFQGCTPLSQQPIRPTERSIATVREAAKEWSRLHPSAAEMPNNELQASLKSFDWDDSGLPAGDTPSVSRDELWRTKNHTFGYIPAEIESRVSIDVQDAYSIQADASLKGKRIKLTLDRLKIAKYPGKGNHDIAFNFFAQTQSSDELIPLSYSVGVSARDGDEVPVVGKQIFVGVNVGTEGLNLMGSTTNVDTKKDRTFFSILAGKVFAQGLQIVQAAQPTLRPLTELVDGVSKELSNLNKGVPVQAFDIGLDFSNVASRIKLREGSYIVVQIPPSDAVNWKWADWQYANGRIQLRTDPTKMISYNYMVLGVSRLQ